MRIHGGISYEIQKRAPRRHPHPPGILEQSPRAALTMEDGRILPKPIVGEAIPIDVMRLRTVTSFLSKYSTNSCTRFTLDSWRLTTSRSTALRRKSLLLGGLDGVGWTGEENGPALTVQCGKETLEPSVERMVPLHTLAVGNSRRYLDQIPRTHVFQSKAFKEGVNS